MSIRLHEPVQRRAEVEDYSEAMFKTIKLRVVNTGRNSLETGRVNMGFTSQAAFPIWQPACPMWRVMTSRMTVEVGWLACVGHVTEILVWGWCHARKVREVS